MTHMADFLEGITYQETWLELEATEAGDLPAYLGSTLRGALGRLLRPALCVGSGCGNTCQQPESCEYFAVFERSRAADGRNAPKPLILEAPVTEQLEQIAMGGPVFLPYATGKALQGEQTPTLQNNHVLRVERGSTIRVGLRMVGPLAVALAPIVETVGRYGLNLGGVPYRLRAASDGGGRVLFDARLPGLPTQQPVTLRLRNEPEHARRVRIVFVTPAIVNLGGRTAFEAEDLAACFFEHCLARAVQVHNYLTGRAALPWLEAPWAPAKLMRHQLYRYRLPRYTFRQRKRLDFDGVVGYLDLEGDLDSALPFARAAEVLHFGQKATFGLGKVRVLVLE